MYFFFLHISLFVNLELLEILHKSNYAKYYLSKGTV